MKSQAADPTAIYISIILIVLAIYYFLTSSSGGPTATAGGAEMARPALFALEGGRVANRNQSILATTRNSQEELIMGVPLSQINSVCAAFPGTSRNAIIRDLAATRNVNRTSNNIIEGRLPEMQPAELQAIAVAAASSATTVVTPATSQPTSSSSKKDITKLPNYKYINPSQLAASASAAAGSDSPLIGVTLIDQEKKEWKASADQRSESLVKRKMYMMQEARRKFEEKQLEKKQQRAQTTAISGGGQ